MAIVITKKTRTILLIILAVLVIGGGGYLLWRVNQPDTVAPDGSSAANPCPSGWEACQKYTNAVLWRCGDSSASSLTGYYKCVTGTDGNGCMQSCSVPGGEVPSCSTRVSSDMSKPVESRCLDKGNYSYECGTYCYLPSNGPTCCGNEGPPDYCVAEYPKYNALPYTTTAASQKSELIIYYQVIPPYTDFAQFIFKDPDDETKTISVNASSTQDRIATGIILDAGESATITAVYDSPGSNVSTGWQSVNSGNTCGSGAMGPIQNNDCERYEKKDVSSYISWANSSTDESVISRQCWADAKEWEGDYDFEDFFVQLAYLPIAEEQTNPDWTIEKNVEGEYIVENGKDYATVDYTVIITNVGDGDGNIDKIVDELDDKVLEDYIQEISNDGVYSSGTITWDLEGTDEVFDPNENLELTYSFQIPESAYGNYRNIVTAYPTEGDNFSDDAMITLVADEEEPVTAIPQTGILDTIIGRILLGFSFIFFGGLVSQYSRINYFFNAISDRNRFKRDINRRKRFERRIKR